MAISTPADLTVLKQYELLTPPVLAEPLNQILLDTNHLYAHFRPALISRAPTCAPDLDGDRAFICAVVPSLDGLAYTFQHRILPEATFDGTGIPVTVETCTGDDPAGTWATLHSGTTTGTGVGVGFCYQHTSQISADVRMVRCSYSRTAGSLYQVGHILAYPDPGDVTAGVKPSGFVPYDPALLAMTGAPVTTELVDRGPANAVQILRDRKQVLCSFGQNYTGNDKTKARHKVPCVGSPFPATAPVQAMLCRAVACVPGQLRLTAHVYVLAEVDGGSGVGLIRVKTPYGSARLDASGLMEGIAVPVPISMQADGSEGAAVPFEIWVDATAGNHTYLLSCDVLWTPGD